MEKHYDEAAIKELSARIKKKEASRAEIIDLGEHISTCPECLKLFAQSLAKAMADNPDFYDEFAGLAEGKGDHRAAVRFTLLGEMVRERKGRKILKMLFGSEEPEQPIE